MEETTPANACILTTLASQHLINDQVSRQYLRKGRKFLEELCDAARTNTVLSDIAHYTAKEFRSLFIEMKIQKYLAPSSLQNHVPEVILCRFKF